MILDNCYSAFINLDHRKDRFIHMGKELARVGIVAERFTAFKTSEHSWDADKTRVMRNRTPGAIGCWFSQRELMRISLALGKHAFVMEDDLIFCSDIHKRLELFYWYTATYEWDIFWLGGTYHINPPWWHRANNPELPGTTMRRDAELTDDPRIIRTYGCFSTFAYIVNVNSIEKILKSLDSIIHLSMGIDWAFIKLQPYLFTYAFAPGCVKQMDSQSDIGRGITYFSGFAKLGKHWFADTMEEFKPEEYNWHELKNK